MPIGSVASTQQTKWSLRDKDFKHYFHFDARHSRATLEKLATDDAYVTKHAFYPLILFSEEWTRFRINGLGKKKVRPLRYASRLDAAIYACHRFRLSIAYEEYLKNKGIEDVPIAYRKIPKEIGRGNKCNIEFAKDAFDFIRSVKHCDVTVVDISSFFESLDHKKIKETWVKVVGRNLTQAENAVLRSITRYSVVDRERLFEGLGLWGKGVGSTKTEQRMRKIDKIRNSGQRKLCKNIEFRELICGHSPEKPSIIQINNKNRGIPQGTPISDLIANVYMIDLDLKVARWARKRGGRFYRYCDDIIIILPRRNGQPFDLASTYLKDLVKRDFEELIIKSEKIAICRFMPSNDGLNFTHIYGPASINGLEYLGFQYDGRKIQLKNSTLSNAWRKMKRRSHGWAKRFVRRYRLKGEKWILSNADLIGETSKVLRVFRGAKVDDYSKLTFRNYVDRCTGCFKDYENNFQPQIKKYKRVCHKQFSLALNKALKTYK